MNIHQKKQSKLNVPKNWQLFVGETPKSPLKFELFKFQGTHIQVWGGKTTEGFTTSNHHAVDDV